MLDNGAFSVWRRGYQPDWPGYYKWTDRWLDYPNTWAVIPDNISGTPEEQDALIKEWPHGDRGVPVWHLHEPVDRLLRLLDEWPRVAFGSSGEYAQVLSEPWRSRMDEAWNAIATRHRRTPWTHMLRGLRLAAHQWPFASVDSTNAARNGWRPNTSALDIASRWDAIQPPPSWQPSLIEVA